MATNTSWSRATNYTIPDAVFESLGAESLHDFLNRKGGTMLLYITAYANQVEPVPTYDVSVGWEAKWRLSSGGSSAFMFELYNIDKQALPSDLLTYSYGHKMRYVLIPAGRVSNGVASVNGRSIAVDQLKTMSYEQAGAVFGWEE